MAITYTPTTNFGAKDSLPTNDPDKVIKGSEFSTEFVAIQTAFSLAAPTASPTFTGTVTIASVDINGGNIDGTVIGAATPAAGSFTTGQFGTSLNVDGTVTADGVSSDGNISMSGAGTGSRYVILGDETNTYAGSLVMQAGGGSAAYGGSVIAYGHSHATKPGDIVAGISSGSGGSFRVNTSGIDGGADVLVVKATGNVGIGTTSPGVSLHVDASGGGAIRASRSSVSANYVQMDHDGTNGTIRASGANALIFDTNSGERMRIDASGNLLVGTTSSPKNWNNSLIKMRVANGIQFGTYSAIAEDLFDADSLGIACDVTESICFGSYNDSSYTEHARIDASGNLLVGTTQTPATLITTSTTSHAGVGIADGYLSIARDLTGSAGSGGLAFFNRLATDGPIVDFRKDGTTVGSIGIETTGFYVDGEAGHTGLKFRGFDILPRDNGADVDGTVSLGGSASRFGDLYLSGGVYLGGTGAANLLDDYEEGTWTPSGYSGWATNPTSVSAAYTKIGRLVMLTVKFTGGSFNNQCYLTGVPFSEVKEGTAPVVNGSISVSATAMVASGDRIWFNATNGQTSDGSQFSVVYETT